MAYFHPLVALTAASLLFAPGSGPRAAEAAMDYDSALGQATRVLQGGQPVAAEPLFRALLARYPGNPEVLAGLVDSLCRQSRYGEGLAAAASAAAGNAELERQRHRCDFKARLAAFQSQPSRTASLADLRTLHEDWPDDPYTTGWLYARALEAQGRPGEAEALYGRLAERYPADGDFARQRDRLQSARSLAGARAPTSPFRSAYRNQAMASVGGARYDRDSPDDAVQSLSVSHSGQGYALTLGADHQQRFGQSSSAFSATLDTRLAPSYDGAFSASLSPEGRFLPEYSVAADIGRYIGAGRAYVAVRHLSFENSSATVVSPGFLWEARDRMRLDTRVYWVPTSDSWSVMVTPQWVSPRGHRTMATVSAGMASEQLDVVGGTLRASTYSVRLGQRWRVSPQWAVGGEIFHEHRSGLYNRSGASLQAVYSW